MGSKNTKINWQDYNVTDQLFICIRDDNMPKFIDILKNNPDVDLNAKCTLEGGKGYTLFLLSIAYINQPAMKILLNHNVDIYLKSDDNLDFADIINQKLTKCANILEIRRITCIHASLLNYMIYHEEYSKNKVMILKLRDMFRKLTQRYVQFINHG